MNYLIQTRRLSKTLKGQPILHDVDLHVGQGEWYMLLGPAGAGKTTLLHLLTGLQRPSDGHVELFGRAVLGHTPAVLKRIGTLIGSPQLYERLSVLENLELHMRYMGLYQPTAIEELLEQLQLTELRDTPVQKLASGAKQQVALARALLTRPELLLLDEPFAGLDSLVLRNLRLLLQRLNQEYGTTLLITSQRLQELDQLVQRVGVLRQGRLIEELSLADEVVGPSDYIEIVTDQLSRAFFLLEHAMGLKQLKLLENRRICIYDRDCDAQQILRTLVMEDIPIELFQKRSDGLEERMFHLLEEGKGDD